MLAPKPAMANSDLHVAMAQPSEFPHLVTKLLVHGIPHIVMNKAMHTGGRIPEPLLEGKLMTVMGSQPMADLGTDGKKRRGPSDAERPAATAARRWISNTSPSMGASPERARLAITALRSRSSKVKSCFFVVAKALAARRRSDPARV